MGRWAGLVFRPRPITWVPGNIKSHPWLQYNPPRPVSCDTPQDSSPAIVCDSALICERFHLSMVRTGGTSDDGREIDFVLGNVGKVLTKRPRLR